jgi:uncharacterized protein
MARNLHVPIRMCIQCRERLEQKHLIRLQCKEKQVVAFDGVGRSLYVCMTCIENPKLVKQLAGRCKSGKDSHNEISSLLKELRADDR